MLDGHHDGQPIQLSELRAVLGMTRGVRLARVAQTLTDMGLLVDDVVPTLRSWIEDRSETLPAGFRAEVRAGCLSCST